MKRINHNLIIIPLEFKVACMIYKVDPQEVLQVFIDHTTLFDSLCEEYSEGFSEVTRTIAQFVRSKPGRLKKSKALLNCKDIAINSIAGIFRLAKKKRRKVTVRRRQSNAFVNAIFKVMERPHTPSNFLYIDENSYLKLNKDFCVLSELHSCYPKEYLEYFMSRISAAEEHARSAIKKPNTNFTFDFFMKVANGLGRDANEKLNLSEHDVDFYERMAELRLELYNIRNLDERTAILRDFYQSHYQSMNLN
jgi:hypothetical protein